MDDKSFTLHVSRKWTRIVAIVGVTALVVAPLTAVATHSFTDVPNSNTFHADIAWLNSSGVTKGCNPPSNTQFCPDDPVTRAQMSAFMRRLAQYVGAEDGTPAQADHADDADTVGGLDVPDLITRGPALATVRDNTHTETTSMTYVNIPNMSKQVTIPSGGARDALITFTAVVDCLQSPLATAWCRVRVLVDGNILWDGEFSGVQHSGDSGAAFGDGSHSLQTIATNLAPGNHTITVQYSVDEPNASHQLRHKLLSIMTFPTSVTDISASAAGTQSEDEK